MTTTKNQDDLYASHRGSKSLMEDDNLDDDLLALMICGLFHFRTSKIMIDLLEA